MKLVIFLIGPIYGVVHKLFQNKIPLPQRGLHHLRVLPADQISKVLWKIFLFGTASLGVCISSCAIQLGVISFFYDEKFEKQNIEYTLIDVVSL